MSSLGRLALILALAAPAALSAAELTERQNKLLENNCLQCHARAGTGAPLIGEAGAWRKRAAQGEEALLRNAVFGLRGMPPFGYCSACSEEDLRALIRFMADLPESAR